jgi:hypothetical protein
MDEGNGNCIPCPDNPPENAKRCKEDDRVVGGDEKSVKKADEFLDEVERELEETGVILEKLLEKGQKKS